MIKKVFLWSVSASLCWGAMEFTAWSFAATILGGMDTLKQERVRAYQYRPALAEELNGDETAAALRQAFASAWEAETVHPYFGYVYHKKEKIVANGFPSKDIFAYSSPQDYNVVMLGGSVACQTHRHMGSTIVKAVQDTLADQGKQRNVHLYLFAAGGYKQPQQLMILTYFLAMGAKIDAVINIDGYNELAIAWFNYKDNVHISLPYYWRYRTHSLTDSEQWLTASEGLVMADWEKSWAMDMDRAVLAWSPTLTLVWKFGDSIIEARLNRLHLKFEQRDKDEEDYRDFPPIGPSNPASLEEAVTLAQQIWWQSNTALYQLLQAHGIPYVHLLQPNQYIEGSKTLTRREKKIAFTTDFSHAFAKDANLRKHASDKLNTYVIPTGYLGLRELGKTLPYQMNFIDGTMLYRNVEKDIYIDDCCHVNQRGTALIWKAIRPTLLRAITSKD